MPPLSPSLNSLFGGSQNDRFSIFNNSPPQASRNAESNFYFPDATYSELDRLMVNQFDETVFDALAPFQDERPRALDEQTSSSSEAVPSSTLTELSPNRNVAKKCISMSGKEIRKAAKKKKDERLFPFRLHELASSENFQPLNWAVDGTCLSIDMQSIHLHLKEICRSKKYSSFLRQLHLYGFRKVSRCLPNTRVDSKVAIYRHPLFLEHSPELLEKMVRIK